MEFTIENSGSRFEIAVSGAFDHHEYGQPVDSLLSRADWRPGTPILVDEIALDASKTTNGMSAPTCFDHGEKPSTGYLSDRSSQSTPGERTLS
jgi:hypothetical protein